MRMTALCLAAVFAVAGCATSQNAAYTKPAMKAKGLVMILPGIEGTSLFNKNIRLGLIRGGARCAMPIQSWGWPIPGLGMALNQMDVPGHRAAGKRIAREIARYQRQYPGRPVYLVAHSGGAGVVVFALEAMAKIPGAKPVDGVLLLSPSLSASYDLTVAMDRTRMGIVSFYNRGDLALLGIATTILGNVDGGRGPCAGRVGFKSPAIIASGPVNPYSRLYQVQVTGEMTASLGGAHLADTSIAFVAKYVAPWVRADEWPLPDVMTD